MWQDLLSSYYLWGGIGFVALLGLIRSFFRNVGETEMLLLTRRFSLAGKMLKDGNPVAFDGEPGYQAEVLTAGWHPVNWILYSASRHPYPQIPTGEIGLVYAQVGRDLRVNQRSGEYHEGFGYFQDPKVFVEGVEVELPADPDAPEGTPPKTRTIYGQKGMQRPVLPPGTNGPIHPVCFLVLTRNKVYGIPVDETLARKQAQGKLTAEDFGVDPRSLVQTKIEPSETGGDICGIVVTHEGPPIPEGAIASRIGNFEDISAKLSDSGGAANDADLIELLIASQNDRHDNYQNFQAFLDAGGHIGMQHDPLLYGTYNLNPYLVAVQRVPMLVVEQGEVAVIKAYVGLATEDTSGETFKFGSIVRPGHRGVWSEPLRTGKYAINPHIYKHEMVQTFILTLNWATAESAAHGLDSALSQIRAKSREGFVFSLDLQVQIHVPDTKAAEVISMVGSMSNLVNEVLQAAVGNHFRDKLQSMPAVEFINSRQKVQEDALAHIQQKLLEYKIETRGVYIQDVIFPDEMVQVLTEREIATQLVQTLKEQKLAEDQRILMEAAKGKADQQAALARSEVGVQIQTNQAAARKAEADGEATYLRETGEAAGAKVLSIGKARAEAYAAQVAALGNDNTALVNVVNALAEGGIKIVPDVSVTSSGAGGAMEGLMATLTGLVNRDGGLGALGLSSGNDDRTPARAPVPVASTAAASDTAQGQQTSEGGVAVAEDDVELDLDDSDDEQE